MGGRSPIQRLGTALAVLLVAQQALASNECRTGCKGSAPETFKYAVGTTYKYDYDGKIEISLSSAEGQSTSTEVKAQVQLTQLGDCNQILKLHNVQILGPGGKKHGQIPDVEKPIRLNFNDGKLEDSICVEAGDNQNSINIKRAIASIFQANLKGTHETDVFGLCPTSLTHHKEGNLLVVHKSRNLNKCAYRENINQDFISTNFNLNSEFKSSPVLSSDYNAKLKIKNGILDEATLTEEYLYVPFSVGNKGAKAVVTSKLILKGTGKDSPAVTVSQPKSIIFDDPHPVVAPTSNTQTILNAVKETEKTISDAVGEKTAKEFVTLIKVVRASKKTDLLNVYNQVKSGAGVSNKEAAKKIYLDALLRAGNADTVEVVVELLKNKELNEIEEKLAYLGLNLVRHASESALISVAGLLDQKNLPREAYLGIGNLAGRYCRQHSCHDSEAVKKLSDKFISKLGDNKADNRKEENDIIYIIKALRNFHYLGDNLLQKLVATAQDKKTPNRLRVAALEAFLADPCKDKLRDTALNILKDVQQDAEVRIKAYLVVAQCPNAKIGNAVKALLEKEPSYQVGGFIASHIRNLKASANGDKISAKQFLNLAVPANKFPVDPRKYSFNGELSYSVPTLGVAASSESNLIYSQNSWLPRSTSLNLTAEVFGHNFNFLEIETRQENLDKLLEHYLGPKGIARGANIEEIYDKYESYAKTLSEAIEKKVTEELKRSKRDVTKAEIDNIAKQVQIKTNELNKDLDLDISLKVFGSEVLFLNFNEDIPKVTPESLIDKLVTELGKGLDQLKSFEKTVRSNLLFLDAEIDYPTSLGFPLRLAAEGTSNIQIQTKGALDARKLFIDAQNGHLKLHLAPSANIEVSGRLTLDALVVENGLKVSTTLYTSVAGEVSVEWTGHGEVLDVKFNVPEKDQRIVSATHDIVFHSREQAGVQHEEPLKFNQVKDFSVCVDQLSPFVGLTFCFDVSGPNLGGKDVPVLPFPLSGYANLEVKVQNEDISQFHIKRQFKTGQETSASLLVETIGKNKQRKTSVEFEGQISPQKYFKAVLTSPIKSASVEGRITNTNNEKSILLRLLNDKAQYLTRFGASVSGSESKAVYKPIFEIISPAGPQPLPANVEGQIVVEKAGSRTTYLFENLKIYNQQKAITANGNIGHEPGVIFGDFTLSDGTQSGSLKGRIAVNPNHQKFNVELQNTINPDINFNLKGELKTQPEEYDTNLQLIHGRDLSSKTNILTISSNVMKKYKSPQDYTIGTKNKLTYPLFGIEGKFEFEQTPKSLDYDLDIKYHDIKFGTELDAKINQKTFGDYEIEFEVYGLENHVEINARRQIQGEESKISNSIQVNDKKVEINGKVKHEIKPNHMDIGTDLEIVVPMHKEPVKVVLGLKLEENNIDTQSKIVVNGEAIVDAFLKANRDRDANGSIKVNIKNYLVVNGQIKAVKGKGNGNILIDSQAGKHQLKAETNFHVELPSIVNVELILYPAFNKNQNEKIVFKTDNKLSENSVDSKNQVDFLGYKVEVNAKGSKQGANPNKKLNGELEISLPGDQFFQGKFNTENKLTKNLHNGKTTGLLEYRKNKNERGSKISFHTIWKNTDLKEHVYDVEYSVSADNGNGANINGDLAVKRSKQGEAHLEDVSYKVHGSVLKHPLEGRFSTNYKNHAGQYEVRGTYGPSNVVDIKGKYDLFDAPGKWISGDVSIDAQSSASVLKTVKVAVSGSALKPKEPKDILQLKGSVSVFADDDGTIPGPTVDFKTDGEIKGNTEDHELKVNSAFAHEAEKASLALDVSHKDTEKRNHIVYKVDMNYGEGKTIKVDTSFDKTADHHYKINSVVETPFEGHKLTKFSLETKRDNHNRVTSTMQLDSEGKVWHLDSDLTISDTAPVVDIKLKCPQGKLSEIFLRGNRVSDKEFSGEIKLLHEAKQFTLEGGLDVDAENVENFLIKGHVNSANLNLNKITFEAQNKPGSTDRKIQVHVKSGGKNLVSGSTSYAAREEHGKYIVEGAGSFKVKDETKSGNFKFISNRLSKEKNREQGLEISFDAGLGDKAIDAEFKATNKQFRILQSYCEKKKECAHVEIDNKINSMDLKQESQVLEVNIDLRKLGLSHEFGLKSVTSRKEYVVVDHTTDIHLNSANNKYQYSLYFHPQKAGVTFTTPKRIVALESHGKRTPNSDPTKGGKVSGEIVFYLDKKNHPEKKTSLTGFFDVQVQDHSRSVQGEVKLVLPGLQKPLSISHKSSCHKDNILSAKVETETEFDIFAQANQKIVTSYKGSYDLTTTKGVQLVDKMSLHIKSAGLGVNIDGHYDVSVNLKEQPKHVTASTSLKYEVGKSKYDNLIEAKLTNNEANFVVTVLNTPILRSVNKMSFDQNNVVVDSEVTSYDNKPVVSHLEVKNSNTIKFTTGFKNQPNKKLQINAGFIPGQISDVRADVLRDNTKTNLFHATIKLDEANFLKPDYNVDSKAIESLLQNLKNHASDYANGFESVGKEWTNDLRKESQSLGEIAKKATPNLQHLKQYYKNELEQFEQEIINDKSLKEISEVIRSTLALQVKFYSKIFEKSIAVIEEITKVLQQTFAGVLETIDKELLPQLRTINEKLVKAALELFHYTTEIVLSIVGKVTELVERYRPEFKVFAETFLEITSEFGRAVQQMYNSLRNIAKEQYERILNEIKASPILEEIKSQYNDLITNGLPNGDRIAASIKEFIITVKEVIPAEVIVKEEIIEILDIISQYIDKRVNAKEVNELETVQRLGETLTKLVKKLLGVLSAEEYNIGGKNTPLNFLTFEHLKNIPALVSVKFSPVSFFLHEDVSQEIANLLLSLINTPKHLIPPFHFYGLIVQGQHLFTFDGKHITFPGKCNYLLVRDAYNGNFSIAGTYKDGLLTAITVADKHNQITLLKGGQVKADNAAAELPVRKPELAAYRNYEIVTIASTAGVKVECTPDLIGCAVSVSGFYHGQLRGLLGNGNHEPYDDFALPNGKIVTSESEFGNSYKLASSCPAVTAPGHEHVDNAVCNKLFGWESSLAVCYPFVPTENFKLACAHGLASNVKDTEVAVAKAYVAACVHHGIIVNVPKEMLKCTNGDKEYDVGTEFSVKLPSKAADIVLLVDTVKKNEPIYKELITPLVTDLTKELHAKGINDVEFHLITYGGENQWPSHVTVGGKLTFKGRVPNIKFTEKPKKPYSSSRFIFNDVKRIAHSVKLALGLNLEAATYNEGIRYPFRVNALKSVVAVISEQCEVGDLYPLQKLRTLLYRNNQISLNLFTPFDGLTVKDAKKTKDIVGFNTENVFTLSQGKKNPKGTPELHKSLDYDDYCSDFTIRNRGNVFVSDNFLAAKPADKKQFTHIAAQNILEQMINIEQGLDCQCRQISPWHAQNVCFEEYSKERSSKKV